MSNIQEIFNRIEEHKKEKKEIRAAYKDALESSLEYKKVVEELSTLKEKKKQIEMSIKDDFRSEFDKLDDLKIDLESDAELLSDACFNKLVKGEPIEIMDEYENKYEPIFKVNFKKIR